MSSPMAWAAIMLAALPCIASGAPEKADKTGERVAELIGQLNSDKYAAREAAQRELAEIGSPALPALRQATESADPEVASRAQQLLRTIRAQALRRRRDAFVKASEDFVEGAPLSDDVELPAWDAFREIVGRKTRPARKLYAQILVNEEELIRAMLGAGAAAAVGNSPAAQKARRDYLAVEAARWETFFRSLRAAAGEGLKDRLKKNRPFALSEEQEARLMAFAFAHTQLPPTWTAERTSKLRQGLLVGYVLGKQDRPAGRAALYHRLKEKGERVGCIRRLVAAWCKSRVDDPGRSYALGAAMQLRLKNVSLDIAERILRPVKKDDNRPELNATFLAIHALMLWGKPGRHVRLLEPFLQDDRPRRLGAWVGRNPPRKSIFMREWAFMAILRISGQDAKDYGTPTSMKTYCAAARFVRIHLYVEAGAWEAAMRTWKQWSAENPEPAPKQTERKTPPASTRPADGR
jgi:hypothetical protein